MLQLIEMNKLNLPTKKISLSAVLLGLFLTVFVSATQGEFGLATTTAIADGNFNNAATWNNGVPTGLLIAVIPTGRTVNVNANVAAAQTDVTGTINGTGTLTGNLFANNGGTIAPGNSPGILTVNGNVAFNAGSIFAAEINGTTVGTQYDQLVVNGTVTINNSSQLGVTFGFLPVLGNTFILINNDGNDAIVGTFNSIPQGFQLPLGGNLVAAFSYIGGDGNDFTIRILSTTAASVSISGRVLTPEGNGINRAIVTMTDSTGEVRILRTNAFGFYRFEEVGSGENYVLEIRSKQYQFEPRALFVSAEIENLDFVPFGFNQ